MHTVPCSTDCELSEPFLGDAGTPAEIETVQGRQASKDREGGICTRGPSHITSNSQQKLGHAETQAWGKVALEGRGGLCSERGCVSERAAVHEGGCTANATVKSSLLYLPGRVHRLECEVGRWRYAGGEVGGCAVVSPPAFRPTRLPSGNTFPLKQSNVSQSSDL